jgi:hypothetical protein
VFDPDHEGSKEVERDWKEQYFEPAGASKMDQ